VGCGAGEILKQLSASMPSTNFTGCELSPQAFELCKTRQSEKVQYRFENILDEDVFYDCLLCIDVFEHVEDCIGFLRSLKPKATYKVFHIPLDISMLAVWRGSMMTARQSVGHLHYFTPDTALATLRDSGYQVIDSFHTQYLSDLPSKSILSKIKKIPRKILYRVAPDLIVKILGGYSLIVLAK
jgi:trans-aconitate methyltransferase